MESEKKLGEHLI